MCLYVLSSVLLISLVFFLLSCHVSLCSEFRVAYFFNFCCAVLLCVFMFWVPCCSFHNFLCVVLLCIFMFWVPCCSFHNFLCVVLLCIFMFWVPCCSFHNFFLYCPVMYLYVLSSVLLISLVFCVLSWYVSLCSEFRVAYFFSFFPVVLLCVFMFCVRVAHFCSFFFSCPVMYLYVLSSVLLIS
jgi:hypothetical protein